MSISHLLLSPLDSACEDLDKEACEDLDKEASRESELDEVAPAYRRFHSLAFSMTEGKRIHMHNDGIPRFDPIIFLEQLAVQCLFPLSYLYVYFIYGPQAIRIQNFSLWFQVSNPFGLAANAFHILPWVYFFKAEELKEGGITFAEVAAVMMAGFVFKCMVASKYASLGKAEYLRVLGETNPVAADEYMKELQLLTGWLTLDLAHMIHEAELAFARMGLYNGDCETRFRIPRAEIWKWAKLVREEHRALLEKVCVPSRSCSDVVCIEASGLLGLAFTASHPKKLDLYLRALGIFASFTLA